MLGTEANSGTLYSLVLTLSPIQEAVIEATMGDLAHAAFLRAVQEVDPVLSADLHNPAESIRPFTVSPLRGIPRARGHTVLLRPEETYWLRVTILYPPLYERFMTCFLDNPARPILRIGSALLSVREILVTPGSHPWAGYTTWAQMAAQASVEDEISLAFTSPTAFSFGQRPWGKKIVVWPQPDLVFGSLIRVWNAWAPVPLQIEKEAIIPYLQEDVVVTRIGHLETRMLHFGRAPQIGFVGQLTYGLMAGDDYARRVLNALADFAFYAGVGMKTTMGMGQTRRRVQDTHGPGDARNSLRSQ